MTGTYGGGVGVIWAGGMRLVHTCETGPYRGGVGRAGVRGGGGGEGVGGKGGRSGEGETERVGLSPLYRC